jgi:hypothetical protein
MMTEVTTDFAKSHASETRAGLHPCTFAIGAIRSRIFQVRRGAVPVVGLVSLGVDTVPHAAK